MIAYKFLKRKYLDVATRRRKDRFPLHVSRRMDLNEMYIIKVYKKTLIGATKRIDNQFSAFSSLPFPKLDMCRTN